AVDIPCAAFRSSAANPRIEWKFQRGNSLLLFYYDKQLTESYRSRVQFSPTSIRLSAVSRADSGRYICEVVGEGGDIARSEVTLIVQGKRCPWALPLCPLGTAPLPPGHGPCPSAHWALSPCPHGTASVPLHPGHFPPAPWHGPCPSAPWALPPCPMAQ
ncbi:JAM1 protein, partial [Tricholaema leucomelas]|nr:JAM1 protein [Tricholaema leucomelas]